MRLATESPAIGGARNVVKSEWENIATKDCSVGHTEHRLRRTITFYSEYVSVGLKMLRCRQREVFLHIILGHEIQIIVTNLDVAIGRIISISSKPRCRIAYPCPLLTDINLEAIHLTSCFYVCVTYSLLQ